MPIHMILSDNRVHTAYSDWDGGCESIDYVDNPHDVALYASAVLAADKGIASELQRNDYNGYDVVTDEGKRFSFRRR